MKSQRTSGLCLGGQELEHKFKWIGLVAFFCMLVLGARMAGAETVTADARIRIFSNEQIDTAGPVTSGAVLALVEHFDASSTEAKISRGLAGAHVEGTVAQELSVGVIASASQEVVSISENAIDASISSSWAGDFENDTGQSQTYVMMLNVNPTHLKIVGGPPLLENPGPNDPPPGFIDLTIEVLVNDVPIDVMNARLEGNHESFLYSESGHDFDESIHVFHPFLLAKLAPFTKAIFLGRFDAGEVFEISYKMTLSAFSQEPNIAFLGRSGDPLDICGDPGAFASVMLNTTVGVEREEWGAIKNLYR